MEKKCTKCCEIKPISAFRKANSKENKYQSWCKQCCDNRYTHACKQCGKEFKSAHKVREVCSVECRVEMSKKRIKCKCDTCNKEIEIKESVYNKNKYHYCSIECKNKGFGINFSGESNPNYNRVLIKCDACGKEIEINRYRQGLTKHNYCSYKCQAKGYSLYNSGEKHQMYGKKHTEEAKKKIGIANKGKYIGKNSPRWNANLTDEEREANNNRHSDMDYIRFIKKVMLRDNYTCVICNKKSGDKNVHHLNGWNWDIENRLNEENAVTLCYKCHNDFHKAFGNGNNTKSQFEEYISNYNKLIRVEG